VRIGDVICFELAWDDTVHDTVRNGAQLLMVQSNNATYTGTGQPYQQWQITKARAIESGRQIAVSTTSSLSGLIQPSGRVADRTREGGHDFRTYNLALGRGVSAGVRVSPWIGWASVVLAAVAVAAGALASRRRR
jgi:apolipoprotein N-acyltransferase